VVQVPPLESLPRPAGHAELEADYEGFVRRFYAFLPDGPREVFSDDAVYHRRRYLDLLRVEVGARLLELGSDKPFISHCLRVLHPGTSIATISIDIPHSPYPIHRVDIESEPFPFEDAAFDTVAFTEVLEHLYRDPSWAVFQINRCLEPGGRLFLTTPNACGWDALQNLLHDRSPNERNRFYVAIESGHPHLWTMEEVETLLSAHGFRIDDASTVDYYEIPKYPETARVIESCPRPELHGQVLRVLATKTTEAAGPGYPLDIFPEGRPVAVRGALRHWLEALGWKPPV